MMYFQDMIKNNHCFGCGPFNEGGLNVKSCWLNETEAICHFQPQAHHCAAPTKFLNGGVVATVIDCHCICTAIAYAYKKGGREIGRGEPIWYATSGLTIEYKRPVPIDQQVTLKAQVTVEKEKTLTVACQLEAGDKICASATVIAASVPSSWME